MDAPPEQEDCRPFITVASYLEAMQLHAPRVLEADLDRGFLLLSDLGRSPYLDVLRSTPELTAQLYTDAINALLKMQHAGIAYQSELPPYDEKLLRFELSLFRDWLCGTHLNLAFSESDENVWQSCCDLLVANALQQPQVFVHRDYHSRNLMVSEQHNPGIIDFQDAVEGPITYDLVSLLKDCYITWPPERVLAWAMDFYAELAGDTRARMSEAEFIRHFELMGVHRHLKAAGIFCRLNYRDGKAGYLDDIPRTLKYVTEVAPRYAELRPLQQLISERVQPSWEADS